MTRTERIEQALTEALRAAEAHGECLGGSYGTCGDDDCTTERDARTTERRIRKLLGLPATNPPVTVTANG